MRDTGKLFDRPRLCRPRIRTTQRYNIVDPAEVRPNVRTNRRDLLFTVKLQSLNPDGSARVILTPPTNIQVQFDFEAGVGPRNIRYGRVNLECRWLLHLRRILAVYTGYYNELRTRLSRWTKIHRPNGPSTGSVSSPHSRSSADFIIHIINTVGYSFRQAHLAGADV
jgi:hypothetical protein